MARTEEGGKQREDVSERVPPPPRKREVELTDSSEFPDQLSSSPETSSLVEESRDL